jgi:hypothetical protein
VSGQRGLRRASEFPRQSRCGCSPEYVKIAAPGQLAREPPHSHSFSAKQMSVCLRFRKGQYGCETDVHRFQYIAPSLSSVCRE